MNKLITQLSKLFRICLLAVIFFACSSGGSSIYDFDYPHAKAYTKSISGNLNVQVPQGWFVAEDNENNTVDLWLVKDDYSATIKFVSLSFNDEARRSFGNEDLSRIVELNKILVKSRLGKSFNGFTNEEQFGGSNAFSAYQYLNEKNQPIRTVVFKFGQQFYESTAFAVKPSILAEVFKAQNSVLASIK